MEGQPKKPGRKKDTRPQIEFRVQQDIYAVLEGLQSETGMTPDQNAGLLLHFLIRDPETVAERFRLLARKVAAAKRSENETGPSPRDRLRLADKPLIS